MKQHTPGPWIMSRDVGGIVIGGGPGIGASPYATMVARLRVHDRNAWPEVTADARLITAAPDLLAALETLLEWFDGDERAEEIARPAIAKARGEG